jgi:predicted nucleic-acid-binding Zn-ribbon protein
MACAKCGSNDVHVIDIDWPGRPIGASIATGMFSNTRVDHHVCTKCGFVESYVTDRNALDKIAEKWPLEGSGGKVGRP